ncbi:hypothetical protein D3C71_1089660 [compost metagenome]
MPHAVFRINDKQPVLHRLEYGMHHLACLQHMDLLLDTADRRYNNAERMGMNILRLARQIQAANHVAPAVMNGGCRTGPGMMRCAVMLPAQHLYRIIDCQCGTYRIGAHAGLIPLGAFNKIHLDTFRFKLLIEHRVQENTVLIGQNNGIHRILDNLINAVHYRLGDGKKLLLLLQAGSQFLIRHLHSLAAHRIDSGLAASSP